MLFACLYSPGNAALLGECAEYFSPMIEETSPDAVIFDIRGLRTMYGTPSEVATEIRRRAGKEANLAIAENPDAAYYAARGIAGTTILPPRRTADILAPLPLTLLQDVSYDLAHSFDIWGIRTFGELVALPASGVVARLGEAGLRLHTLARGAGRRQLRLRERDFVFAEELETEYPIETLEPLQFLMASMLEKLCLRLRFHAQSTNEIRLCLKLERAADHSLTLRLPVPVLNQATLLKLLHLELMKSSPPAAVEKIRLELIPVKPRTTQQGLFLAASPEPEKLEITLARLRALVGDENVGTAEPLDTWRSDAFRMTHPAFSSESGAQSSQPLMRPKLALRRYRPPCPAQVWCTSDGRPVRISSQVAGGMVTDCAGPWRTSGDWWSSTDWDREEWDVALRDAGTARIYREQERGKWFVDGAYD